MNHFILLQYPGKLWWGRIGDAALVPFFRHGGDGVGALPSTQITGEKRWRNLYWNRNM